jgi:hypothetical protein
MKRTILAVMLALALVLIPMSTALAQDFEVEVYATPTIVSLDVDPINWTVNGISGSGSIWPDTTYYAHGGGWADDKVGPSDPSGDIIDGDCRFTFTNNGSVPIAITCDMTDFIGGSEPMGNGEGGYLVNGATDFGATAYASGDAWPGEAVDLMLPATGSALFIESLAKLADAPANEIKWGVALITQSDPFIVDPPTQSTATIECNASEP